MLCNCIFLCYRANFCIIVLLCFLFLLLYRMKLIFWTVKLDEIFFSKIIFNFGKINKELRNFICFCTAWLDAYYTDSRHIWKRLSMAGGICAKSIVRQVTLYHLSCKWRHTCCTCTHIMSLTQLRVYVPSTYTFLAFSNVTTHLCVFWYWKDIRVTFHSRNLLKNFFCFVIFN